MTRRLVLAACAWAAVLAQDQTCVDDPAWVKNGDEPWKDCAWVAEFIPTRCAGDPPPQFMSGGYQEYKE